MGNQGWARPDETHKMNKYKIIRYLFYALIIFAGIVTAEPINAAIVITLYGILRELKRHRYQRALIFERERENQESEQDESPEEEHPDLDPNSSC